MQLLTLRQVSKLISTPESTLRSWAKDSDNQFPAFKLQNAWRVDENDLDDWLTRQKERGVVAPLSALKSQHSLAIEKGGLTDVKYNLSQ